MPQQACPNLKLSMLFVLNEILLTSIKQNIATKTRFDFESNKLSALASSL